MLIDLFLLLILVVLVLSGYRKGLLMSLLSLVVVVLCCMGASLAQKALTPMAADYLEPKVAASIQASMEERLAESTQQALEQAGETGLTIGGQSVTLGDLADLLRRFGLNVEEAVTDGASSALTPAIAAAAQAAARAIVEQIAGVLIFFAAFLILYLVLHSVALAVNVVDRLPVLHTLNRAGGAIMGLLVGLLMMTVAAAVCGSAGLLPEEPGPLSRIFLILADRLL